MDETVAVIGLGAMGGRAAARLVPASKEVHGYDPSPRAQEAAGAAGVQTHPAPEEAVRGADVVVLSLPQPEDVVAAAGTALRAVRPGAVVVDLSTIDPGSARTAAESVAAAGGAYLDAPVLGRPDRCGAWTLAVGGDEHAVQRVRALLESSVARAVVHAGEVGAGSTVKLLNNLMFGAINAATAEVLTTCAAAGVDPHTFVRTLTESGSAAVSNLFSELAPKILDGNFAPTFALGLLQKDNRLALRLSEQLRCPAFVGSTVTQVNNLAVAAGHAAQDTGSVYQLYQHLAAAESANGAEH